nr:ATP-binding protein [Streptomyces polyasparticus]
MAGLEDPGLCTRAVRSASACPWTPPAACRLLRGEVTDRGRNHLPGPRATTPEDETGRGLHLVEALSLRWGCIPQPGGKTVWFELHCADLSEPPGP